MPLSIYLALAAVLAGFAGGFYFQGLRWDASLKAAADARYSALVRVRDTDADLQRLATARGASTEAQLQFQREKAHAIQTAITARLAALPVCAVPGDVVGLLNAAADARPPGAGSAGEPGPTEPAADSARGGGAGGGGEPGRTGRGPGDALVPGAGAALDAPPAASTCGAELAIAARNYAEVCIPNAIERDALRGLYNDVRRRINAPP
jgi:hypothetical protein